MTTSNRTSGQACRFVLGGLVAATVAVALAACAAGDHRGTPPAGSPDSTGRAVAVRLAACLRRHGVDALPPGPQGYDATHPVANDLALPLLRRASKACGLPPLASPEGPGELTARPSYPAGTRALTGLLEGAPYRIEVPARWNRILLLWSHGYEIGRRPHADDPGALTTEWLLQHGYAIAASGYRRTGWAVAEALPDQMRLLHSFDRRFGRPRITIAGGESLGGLISEGLAQRFPARFSGALSLCGVSGGAVGFWNQALDATLAVRTLLMPRNAPFELTGIAHPDRDRKLLVDALTRAGTSTRGRARLALAAALLDLPAWSTGGTPPTRTAAAATQLIGWLDVRLPQYDTFGRLDIERRAHGNPSWTTGIDFRAQLARSVDRRLVWALYGNAGLSLAGDLRRLNQAPRIDAANAAVAYLARNLTPTGALQLPLVTLHTTGDGVVPVENEQALARAVQEAHRGRLLRQLFVQRADHCSFTAAEQITALQILLHRIQHHRWPASLEPSALDEQAADLGRSVNAIDQSDATRGTHVDAHFVRINPPA